MLVRSFQEGDEEHIARIHNLGFKELIDSLSIFYGYSYVKPDDVKKWKSKGELFLAEIVGQPVGYVHVGVWDVAGVRVGGILTHEMPYGFGEYGQGKIAVIPEKRRQGVGSELVRAMLRHVRARGGDLACVRIYSDNTPAKNIFHKFGFFHSRNRFYHPIISKRYPVYFADTRCAVFDLSRPIPKVKASSKVVVREAGKHDVEKLMDYARYIGFFRDTSKEHLIEWIDEQEVVMIAEVRDRIVGCIDAEKKFGHLGVLGVLPEFRRKGMGSMLLHSVLRVLKARGYAKAMTDTELVNKPAWRLYRKLGFRDERRIEAWVKPL